ncbi:MAG: rhomboid family intramembrane serine protease [Anaerolineales bacterium]|nr:rhomboid family intramembrane serine protease [Anaerolineales bacterium]
MNSEQHPEEQPRDQSGPSWDEIKQTETQQPARSSVAARQRDPSGWVPYVTYGLIGITVGIYLLQLAGVLLVGYDIVAALGIKSNQAIMQGQLWRLFTPMFLHSNMLSSTNGFQITAILHIGFNMYALRLFGPGLERYYGRWQFLVLYLVSGFTGTVASFVFVDNPSLGASTAVFGLMAAQGVLAYQNRNVFGQRARAILVNILNLAVINFLLGFAPGIDNWGHFGGFVGGILVAWFGGPLYTIEGTPPQQQVVNQRTTSDFIRSAVAAFVLFAFLTGGVILTSNGLF